MSMFLDGNANYPSCRCKPDCEFPCWQMVGLSDEPCGDCGCAPFNYQPVVIAETPGQRVAREDRAAEVRLRGEERVAELEKEANRKEQHG